MCSNDTLVDTPFQLISGFFTLIKVFCVVSMLNKLPQGCVGGGGGATGLLNKRGGEQQASWFSKQQAVEFPSGHRFSQHTESK